MEGYLVDDDDDPVLKDPGGEVELIRQNEDGSFIFPDRELETAVNNVKKKKYYHIILMDYFMPGMNGDEVTALIQKQENGMCINSVFFVLTADPALSARRGR